MFPSSTVENYLKAIYLGVASPDAGHRLLPMGQLATALGVAPGTATTMVKALAESGLVHYEPYAGVALTPAGEKLAALVVRRHRVIEVFLAKVMGYGWDEVHDEAEQLEHVVSDRLVDCMDEMAGRPEVDPHGDPIPDADGVVKPQEAESLLTCPLHVPVTVTRIIDQDKAFLQFVEGHDLKPGQTIEVEERDAASDSVCVRGRDDRRTTIGTRAASKLLVQVVGVLLLLLCRTPAEAQTTPEEGLRPWAILDNSFFVEEAFNQEQGTFQNALTLRVDDGGEIQSTFTQEWALFSHRHQVSYTLDFQRMPGGAGLGDTAIHYRYQVWDEATGRPAFSPPVSIVVPTGSGDRDIGGEQGVQVALPFSKQIRDLYLHANAGLSRLSGHSTPALGGSVIWQAKPLVNLMLEAVATWPVDGANGRDVRITEVVVAPGLRAGWNRNERQTVIGLAAPITRTPDGTVFGIFAYLSYELPFTAQP